MLKALIIQIGIEKLLKFLNNPKNDKIKSFLLEDKTQSTFAEIYSKYIDFVDDNE